MDIPNPALSLLHYTLGVMAFCIQVRSPSDYHEVAWSSPRHISSCVRKSLFSPADATNLRRGGGLSEGAPISRVRFEMYFKFILFPSIPTTHAET